MSVAPLHRLRADRWDEWPEGGPDVVFRTYLDPLTGRALHVEVALADGPRSLAVNPRRWTDGA